MKKCPSCQEDYNPEAQFYSTGVQEVCGACHDDWEDEQKEKAEERASLANLEVPDDQADASACPRCEGSGYYGPESCSICDGTGRILPADDVADETCAVEGADLHTFDVNAAIARATPEQLGKLLDLTDAVDLLEYDNEQLRIDIARREGELAALDRVQGMMKAGGM